jgi:cyclic dehypoxanthinyl futalosine synthase
MLDRILARERLNRDEILALFREASLPELALPAHAHRMEKADPKRVTYIRDRNINYTNVCVSGCRFCAFYKPPGDPDGYIISRAELGAKIREAMDLGAVQILLQGGLNPDLGLEFYLKMLRFIKSEFGIHVHGFSPPEIVHVARTEGSPLAETLSALADAGLDSLPGGGAEILSPEIRKARSPRKCTAREWLEVMRTAHGLGMKSTATMMFGHEESVEDLAEHLLAVRALQDETGGFTAFIPWTFQPGNTDLAHLAPAGGHAYLKVLALSRLALDNFDHLKVSWVTQGAKLAQAGLYFGADDFGSTMIEENVVAAAGTSFSMAAGEMERLIREAGFEPRARNQAYEPLAGGG